MYLLNYWFGTNKHTIFKVCKYNFSLHMVNFCITKVYVLQNLSFSMNLNEISIQNIRIVFLHAYNFLVLDISESSIN